MNHNRLLTKMSILAFFVLLLVMGATLQPTPTATSTTKAPEEIKEWDYVVFGDSQNWGFPQILCLLYGKGFRCQSHDTQQNG